MASEEAVPSDEEEFHSAAEDGDEVEGKTEQTAVCEDEEGRTFMRAGLESLDLGAMEADMADNDRVSSNSTTADGEQAKRDSEAEGDAKMSGLDNRYVSEEHAPEKDGAVELTEEQIKVIETVTEGAGWSPARVKAQKRRTKAIASPRKCSELSHLLQQHLKAQLTYGGFVGFLSLFIPLIED